MSIEGEVAAALGSAVRSMTAISGGDINDAFRVTLADARIVFVKAHTRAPEGMFAAEAAGLEWLRAGPLRVPRVLAVDDRYLALEWLDLDRSPEPAALGRGLAELHRATPPSFGLDAPNFLATVPQDNTPEPDWPTFYVERRLRPLCARARLGVDRQLDALVARRDLFGPREPPARLHGDLWGGNLMVDPSGAPCLIDPAVYGGHREVDLAMMQLFGGFAPRVFSAYQEAWPLAPGYEERVPLYQLYFLMVHVNLFGRSYLAQAEHALRSMI